LTDYKQTMIDFERRDRIAILRFNRPEARNSFTLDDLAELEKKWIEFRDDNDLWVAILTGAGDDAFSAGIDLKGGAGKKSPKERPGGIHRGLKVLKPIIAAINGLAVGGGLELALACDIRICSDNAMMGLTEVQWGIIPGGGGTQRLPRVVSLSDAMKMIFTGERIDAKEALRIGLVSEITSQERLMPRAMEIAQAICECGPLAIRAAKEAILRGLDLPLDEGIKIETELARSLRATEDQAEGLKAFREKRKPRFKGK
jgi:E-phenylitaconyl-CoA hydratase